MTVFMFLPVFFGCRFLVAEKGTAVAFRDFGIYGEGAEVGIRVDGGRRHFFFLEGKVQRRCGEGVWYIYE